MSLASPTFTFRSTIELSERLSRTLLGHVEAYWAASVYSKNVVSLEPSDVYVFSSFTKMVVETAKENDIVMGWTHASGVIEMPVNQLLVITGPLIDPYIKNIAEGGSPAAKVKLLLIG